jgi:hypothetical protein
MLYDPIEYGPAQSMRLHTLGDLWEGLQMRAGPVRWSKALVPLLIVLAFPHGVGAQQDKVAALKQSLAANQQLQKQYKWVETTVVSMKGEEKSRTQKQCFYGPDGKVQKQQLTAPPQQSAPGGVKGKAVAKKQEEITAAMNQAVALVHTYVPPDPQRIQAAKAAGNLSVTPTGPNSARMDLRNYVKSGDTLSLGLDTASNAIQTVSVKLYLGAPSDAVTLDVTFARLREGLSYPGNVVLSRPSTCRRRRPRPLPAWRARRSSASPRGSSSGPPPTTTTTCRPDGTNEEVAGIRRPLPASIFGCGGPQPTLLGVGERGSVTSATAEGFSVRQRRH